MNRLEQLQDAGVSIWLDTLSRELLDSGAFARLIADSAVTGATSNPTIFAKAITGSDRYDDEIRAAAVRDPQELFFELALDDVRRAADLLRPIYDASAGRDGFVSFECTPDLADDTAATVAQAVELWDRLARPNVMIKVPATDAGVPAIEELTARGINVNVTLLFSVARYEKVIDAYLAGLERRAQRGEAIDAIASVASFFVSRVDAKTDALLPAGSALRGRVAIANARLAYARYRDRFSEPRWLALREAGAHPQRPLWASTGTKDPAYSDVLYVEELIAPDVINTMPEATLRAFADHGDATRTFDTSATDTLRRAEDAGIDLAAITSALEREGVRSFCDSYRDLLACIETKLQRSVDDPERLATAVDQRPRRSRARPRVLIAGSGVAGLETLLALRALAGDRVDITLVTPELRFVNRSMAVDQPFGTQRPRGIRMERVAAEHDAGWHCGALDRVEHQRRVVVTKDGDELPYDRLVLAVGARPDREWHADAVLTFRDGRDGPAYRLLLHQLREGRVNKVAFVKPTGATWPLPLYDLALMTAADSAAHQRLEVELSLITPEEEPLGIFGVMAGAAVARLLDERGVSVHTNSIGVPGPSGWLDVRPGNRRLSVDRIVTEPRLAGPRLRGIPSGRDGFLRTDAHGRLVGLDDVYAAGDATAFPIKHGGLAAQQADAVAEAIAATVGVDIEPQPFRPILRGVLLTGAAARYLRADISGCAGDDSTISSQPLWWPPDKLGGRYLAPYQLLRDDARARAR